MEISRLVKIHSAVIFTILNKHSAFEYFYIKYLGSSDNFIEIVLLALWIRKFLGVLRAN